MTVMQSLLSTFRRSRGRARKSLRGRRDPVSSGESLESRLLLAATPPVLSSNPGAETTIYLDFDGHVETSDFVYLYGADIDATEIATPAYDTDDNDTDFGAAEYNEITEIWERVSEDFRPFDVNVTTAIPGEIDANVHRVAIGGSSSWHTSDTALDNAWRQNSFNSNFGFLPNISFTFSASMTDAFEVSRNVSFQLGHVFGLQTNREYTNSGAITGNNFQGNAENGGIMGSTSSDNLRRTWQAIDGEAFGSIQDDLTSLVIGGLRYRTDDHGDSISAATSIPLSTGTETVSGIISTNADVDVFRIQTLETTATISIEGLDLTATIPGATNPGSNLDPVLTLLDSTGNIVARDDVPFDIGDPNASLSASLTETIGTGVYYIQVSNRGEYGNLGEYTVTIDGVNAPPITVSTASPTYSETAGVIPAGGTVTRPQGLPATAEVVVTLTSSNPSEITVPDTVTIPAFQGSATFDLTVLDDTILDGSQSALIRATVDGAFNSDTTVIVTDVETLTGIISPDPVAENAGTTTLTVTRSNTDLDSPNHWVTVNNQLIEYTPAGSQVGAAIDIEWPGGGARPAGETARDVIVLQDGSVAIYNGTLNSALSVYDPAVGTWQHFTPTDGASADPSDVATGGISAFGNYIFLSDFEGSPGESRGIVRIDVRSGEMVRFAGESFGARLFALGGEAASIVYELNPSTGAIINSFPLPSFFGGPAVGRSLTFDGTELWINITGGTFATPLLIAVDPDDGSFRNALSIGESELEHGVQSIVHLDGLIYTLQNEVISPEFRAFNTTTGTFEDGVNSVRTAVGGAVSQSSFVSAIPGESRLLVVDSSGVSIHEVDVASGLIVDTFATDPLASNPGITFISDVKISDTIYEDLIYVTLDNDEVAVYTRDGVRIDTDLSTGAIDNLNVPVGLRGDLAGLDVQGVSSSNLDFRDVAVGLDGLVYGLTTAGSQIEIHHPETLARVGGITLDRAVQTITIGNTSEVFGGAANGDIILFDATGTTQSVLTTALSQVTDIEVNSAGEILASDTDGNVVATSRSAVQTSDASGITLLEDVAGTAFVSFARDATQSFGDIEGSLQSDDISELQVPATFTIPAGAPSVEIPLTVINDAARDGDQVATVTASATGYTSGNATLTVQDLETVTVEIIPDAVAEDAGTVADALRISRSDVDGPFDYTSTASHSLNGPVPIIDGDVTISTIEVETQIAEITDVNVTLSIEHAAIPDLDVYLISPQGTRVKLFTDLSSSGSNLTNTALDDEAGIRIIDGSAPYTGLFTPEEQLAAFDGETPSGNWSLEIIDDNTGDIGNLLNWSLEFTTIGLAPIVVTLASSDDTEAQVPTTVTIPVNQSSVLAPLDAIPDDFLDGTQTVTVSVTGTDGPDFAFLSDTVDVLDAEILTFAVDTTTVAENAGDGAIQGTIMRTDSSTGAVVLNLVSNDISELSVPATVTIPAGEPSVTFDINAVDDLEFDGSQTVIITATATGYIPATSGDLTVTDQEPRLALTTLTPTISEDEGTITLTIARLDPHDVGAPQVVNLSSSDTSELTVPETVTIPAGEISVPFTATILEDTELDGAQTATISAIDSNIASPGISGTSIDITVEDAERITVTVPSGEDTFSEHAGQNITTATVTISTSGHDSPIFVNLAGSDSSEVSIPEMVIIPVGATSATFSIDAVDDFIIDGTQTLTVTASLENYLDGTVELSVTDHEPPIPVGPTFNTEDPTPTLSWSGIDGASRYDLWVNDVSRNITQLFRMENLPASSPLFEDDFESGTFDSALWAANSGVEIDSNSLNDPNGVVSAHFNGSEEGLDRLESVTMDLSGQTGVQLSYTFEQTGQGNSPADGQDLIVSYRTQEGIWQQLHRQFGADPDMDQFRTIVLNLPEAAFHSNFAFRIESEGPTTQDDENNPVYADWFIDSVILTEHSQFTPVQELGVGRYRYWVRAFDSLEQPMAWSRGQDFLIRTRPEIVSPVTTPGQAFSDFPEISWTSVVDTANYDLWVNNITTGESQVIRETDLQSTSFASGNTGLIGGTYRAWVRAMGPDGTPGYWSGSTTFSVLTAPQNVQPSGETFDRTPEITWDAVPGAANYHVWVNRTDPGQAPVIVLRDAVVSGSSRIPDSDLEDGTYTVWVQAIGADQTRSSWSAATQFTIGGRPVITATGSASEPAFQWTGISGTEAYEFWVDRIDDPQVQVVYDANVTGTSYNIGTALGAGEYRVWVRAVSDMGEFSLWSRPVDFTVASTDSDSDLISVTPVLASLPQEANSTATTRSWDQIVNSTSETAADTTIAFVSAPKLAEEPTASETPVTESIESVDAVMAELAAADWWATDEETVTKQEVPSAAAFGLGLLTTGALRRRKNRQEKE